MSETGDFELLHNLQAFNKIPLYEYRSNKTGLTVIFVEVEGPIVNGFFTLATEAFDDDGLPHTLEHLIFLGSEDFPYKGVLDLLANRCLASGTNAWTDTDHTCYTMETAGSDGFLALMPIYVEHILFPTLTEGSYLTDVHHITGTGDDAGVVYCEMQGRESSAESKMALTVTRTLFPGHCGYSSETGGIMKNLRESTSNAKVRSFHKEFYRPENFKLIITGTINHGDVFRALQKIEQKILSKGDRGPFERPWQSPVPPFPESQDLVVKYPADDEDNGLFCMAWRGPSAATELYLTTAVTILLKYLTEFSSYTLPKNFVEIDDPYASDVDYHLLSQSVCAIWVLFQDVPLGKLAEIKPKLQELLKKIADEGDINMERMRRVIKLSELKYLSGVEVRPAEMLTSLVILQILYGNSLEDFKQYTNPIADYHKLLEEPLQFWVDLLRKYLVDNAYVAIQCIPSKEEQMRMAQEEEERLKNQKEKLGKTGLEEKGRILEEAVAIHNREPPHEMLTSVPIPSLDSINFHTIVRYRSNSDDSGKLDLAKAPVFTCFDHVKTEFAYIFAFLDSSSVPAEQRIYLPLILESLFESPILKDGKLITHEEVIELLNEDAVSYGSSMGVTSSGSHFLKCGSYSHTITVVLKVQAEKFETGIKWLKDILYNIVFTVERMKIIATKMNNAIAQAKRSGRDVAVYALNNMLYVKDSNIVNAGILAQSKFLTNITRELTSEKSSEVTATIDQIWKMLTNPKNTVLHVVGDTNTIQNPKEALKAFLPPNMSASQNKLHVTPEHQLLQRNGSNGPTGCVIGLGCIESSFFYQTVDSISDHEHPDLPALLLYLQYVTQVEGPMWRQIRGKGFSYGYTIMVKPTEGLLYLAFIKASNVVGAYKEAREILLNQLSSKQWDQNLIDSAKSSLIFELIEKEKTVLDVTNLSVISYFRGCDFKYNRAMLSLINKVTVEDLNRVGEKYITPLFVPQDVKTAVTCVPAKAESIAKSFEEFGFDLKVYPSLEESFLK